MAAPRRARPPRQPGPSPRVCAMDTPARRQYLDLKARYPDAILWFRMGDFYETFDGDAEVMARDLNITLTSRESGRGDPVALARLPHPATASGVRRADGEGLPVGEQAAEVGGGRGLVE